MVVVALSDITALFPRRLEIDEENRAVALIDAALELIEEAFLRMGRDFAVEVEASRLLQLSAKRVVREMISEAIHVGENVGRSSASSTTGPQSDSVTWSQGVGVHWGSVHMTDEWRAALGLSGGSSHISSSVPKRYEVPVAYRNSSPKETAEGASR